MVDKLNLKALFILFALVSFVVVAQEDSSENDEEADDDNIEEVKRINAKHDSIFLKKFKDIGTYDQSI